MADDITDTDDMEVLAVVMLLRLAVRERDAVDQHRLDTVIEWLREYTDGSRMPDHGRMMVVEVVR